MLSPRCMLRSEIWTTRRIDSPARCGRDAARHLRAPLAPIDQLGGADRWQHDPGWPSSNTPSSDASRGRLTPTNVHRPCDARRDGPRSGAITREELVPPIYTWLATEADIAAFAEFIALEGGPDADFDDWVACARSAHRLPKLTLAATYWDEMGRGSQADVHTSCTTGCRCASTCDPSPWGACRRGARAPGLNGYLATNRAFQPSCCGSLGCSNARPDPGPTVVAACCGWGSHRVRALSTRSTRRRIHVTARNGSTVRSRRLCASALRGIPGILRGAQWARSREPSVLRRDGRAFRADRARGMTERSCDFRALRVGYDDTVLAPRPWTLLQSRYAAALLAGSPDGPLLELQLRRWPHRSGRGSVVRPCAGAGRRRPSGALGAPQRDHQSVRADVALRATRLTHRSTTGPSRSSWPIAVRALGGDGAVRGRPAHAIDGGDNGLDGIRACLPSPGASPGPARRRAPGPRPGQANALSEGIVDAGLDPRSSAR